jgi:hypothetical protein
VEGERGGKVGGREGGKGGRARGNERGREGMRGAWMRDERKRGCVTSHERGRVDP